eukprot:360288-Chlamydomonas_euryale.AAC.4
MFPSSGIPHLPPPAGRGAAGRRRGRDAGCKGPQTGKPCWERKHLRLVAGGCSGLGPAVMPNTTDLGLVADGCQGPWTCSHAKHNGPRSGGLVVVGVHLTPCQCRVQRYWGSCWGSYGECVEAAIMVSKAAAP